MRLCDETDCMLHPDYQPPKRKEDEPIYINVKYSAPEHSHQAGQIHHTVTGEMMVHDGITWNSLVDNSSLRLNFPHANLDIPIECVMCKHCKELDMKEIILVNKAKELLSK